MAFQTTYTEHAGAKNGGGMWATREEAKVSSNVGRRRNDDAAIDEGLAEIAEDEAEANRAAIEAAAGITVEDVEEGAHYTVEKVIDWEGTINVLRTRSRENAVAAFNATVVERETCADSVRLTVFRCTGDDFTPQVGYQRTPLYWVR